MSDQQYPVIWKLCKRHARLRQADHATIERECADCRSSIFRATMRAWGIKVERPVYRGGFPRDYVSTKVTDKPGFRTPGEFARPLAELFISRRRSEEQTA